MNRRSLLTGAALTAAASIIPSSSAAAYNQRGQLLPPLGGPLKYGVVGDSITGRGSFASDQSKAWAWLLQTRLQQSWTVTRQDATSHHDAQGSTTLGTIDTVPTGCDLVVVGLGTNNAREVDSSGNYVYSNTSIYSDAQALYYNVRQSNPNALIYGLGVWDASGPRTARVDALIGERCAENGGIYAICSDLYDYTPDRLPTGVAAFGGYTTDGFHPNDTGHAALYQRAVNWIGVP